MGSRTEGQVLVLPCSARAASAHSSQKKPCPQGSFTMFTRRLRQFTHAMPPALRIWLLSLRNNPMGPGGGGGGGGMAAIFATVAAADAGRPCCSRAVKKFSPSKETALEQRHDGVGSVWALTVAESPRSLLIPNRVGLWSPRIAGRSRRQRGDCFSAQSFSIHLHVAGGREKMKKR